MDGNGWAVVIGAVFLGISQITQMVLSYFRDKDKLAKLDGLKVDLEGNTAKTKEGTDAASVSARAATAAAVQAVQAKKAAKEVGDKLNGGLDHAIAKALVPVHEKVAEHAEQMEDLRQRVDGFADYVHERNHDLLGALQKLTSKVEIVMARLGVGDKG